VHTRATHSEPRVLFWQTFDEWVFHLPSTQLAFILNLNEHWFTLRQFGAAPTEVDDPDLGRGRWFNLDSFLRKPGWVGSLYLSMVLKQSEQDGMASLVVWF
jgi:ataxin-3